MWLWKRLQAILVRLGIAGLIIAFIAGIIAVAYFAAVFPDWTGFGPPLLDAQGHELPHAKTLWDWLGLLLIPLVLAVGGFFLTRSENRYALSLQERREEEARKIEEQRIEEARKLEEQRTQEARRIEEQRAEDAALQAYLDQMTQLLLHEKLRTSQPDDEVRSVARARTLTVLRVLDGVRKATVLQFLYEARLIGGIEQDENGSSEKIDTVVRLQGADLIEADLGGANLRGVCLEGADLEGADLIEADLGGANLFEVDLGNAKLQWANLKGAYLLKTKLYGANLFGADLTDCIIEPIQLAQAWSLEGAKLPFDMTLPPAPEIEVAVQKDEVPAAPSPDQK
jgi:Pentapeptide repeats (8 copies)